MKRAKQTETMINVTNEYLKNNHVKTESDPVFIVMTHALIEAGIYRGFNYYKADGVLSGGVDTDYIQIY